MLPERFHVTEILVERTFVIPSSEEKSKEIHPQLSPTCRSHLTHVLDTLVILLMINKEQARCKAVTLSGPESAYVMSRDDLLGVLHTYRHTYDRKIDVYRRQFEIAICSFPCTQLALSM